ncbi:MAG: GNAT family N-acetyltransferase [Bdellovibrionota bacterium]
MEKAYPQLQTERLVLRDATFSEIPKIISFLRENEAHFAATDPAKPANYYEPVFWEERIQNARKNWELEQGLRFFFFTREEEELAGFLGFSQLFRGPFQAGYLGYSIGKKFEGQGLMTEAVKEAIRFLFEELNFHRVMANHLPDNERSAAVLARLGFTVEGTAKDYLFINGKWRDHVLNSLTNANWRSPSP